MKAIRPTFTRNTVQSQQPRYARTASREAHVTGLFLDNSHVLSSWHYSGKHVNADASGYSRGFEGHVLLSSFHHLSNHAVRTRIVGGAKARQFSSGRTAGTLTLTSWRETIWWGSQV
jgi:hypothetical protein